jgi:hypothetical protein
LVFRLSKDGLAFRYVFPDNKDDKTQITEESTYYNFPEITKAWLQPMSKAKSGWKEVNPSYEEHYHFEIPVDSLSPIGEGWVYPALFKVDKTRVLISESDLDRTYCGTRLKYNQEKKALQVTFPQKEEVFPGKGLLPQSASPFSTPWRIMSIGSLATITESTLGTDLAAPSFEMDTSYIKGGLASWSWVLLKDDFTNYETSKKFIDYASEMEWPYCLIDADWDWKIGYDRMKELVRYAAEKNVGILLWYNSSGSWNSTTYTPKSKLLTSKDRDDEFQKIHDMGIAGVKVDFFGGDGQSMIAYYHDILQSAAKHHLLVNFHGATLPRGWYRTYPNLMTVEAIKGEEFITFEQINADLAPQHCCVLPFTRNVFDPMDFTPMVLDSIPGINKRTSAAFDLVLPILFTSGIQHIAEIPAGMQKQPDFVKELLRNLTTQWDESKFLDGYPGKFVVMARKKADQWYIVGINGTKESIDLNLDLSFTESNKGKLISDVENKLEQNDINFANKSKWTYNLAAESGFILLL